MARHSINEPRVAGVVGRLVDLVMYYGSVRAAQAALASTPTGGTAGDVIYPNRLHALLSGELSRGVNSATLEAIERSLDSLEQPLAGGERDRVRTDILRAHAATDVLDHDDPIRPAAEASGYPPAVVANVLRDAGLVELASTARADAKRVTRLTRRPASPDWSFQDTALQRCLEALRKSPTRKAGLIVPTGGGKTRIATRIGLHWLTERQKDDDIVLWVTHRKRLHEQARRELQRALGTSELISPTEATALLEKRVRFIMISELPSVLAEFGDRISLVIVDEAHHAAAPSYRHLFAELPLRGLFLTATPNRADALPIGIDEIAFSITYRELFARGVIVEPVFDEPVTIEDLDWSNPESLSDLADYLLERTETDIRKVLVAVSRVDQTEALHIAVHEALVRRHGHVLAEDDVVFVHGAATSTGASPLDLLDEFSAHPRGILIATSQLIGEGFDDPSIDAVVVTFPSSSIGHLMQVAGRAIRSAPGKTHAHIIQVHATQLAYHFEQRWLYQDISDALRPHVIDLEYHDISELRSIVHALLVEHHVDAAVAARIETSLETAAPGEPHNLLLTGLPYYGRIDEFGSAAPWGAVLVSPTERPRFLEIFNTFSDRLGEVTDHVAFLGRYVPIDTPRGSNWKSYIDMLAAMEYARKEIERSPYEGEANREYVQRRGTSWLKYINFEYRPVVPTELDEFLRDAVNREDMLRNYLRDRIQVAAAVKVELPLAGTFAFLLARDQADWISAQRLALMQRVNAVLPQQSFAEIHAWRLRLLTVPAPQLVLDHIDELLGDSGFAHYFLSLEPKPLPGSDSPRSESEAAGEGQLDTA
jgi:superfamily II DNA or RNA helicase